MADDEQRGLHDEAAAVDVKLQRGGEGCTRQGKGCFDALQQKYCSPVFKMFIVEWIGRVEGCNSQNTVTARALASKVTVHASDKVRCA